MLLVAGNSVRGLPVVTVRGGEDVAEVKDIVYQADAGRIEGFTLNKRGLFTGKRREVLPTEQVHAIGADAVMILDEECLRDPGRAPVAVGAPGAEAQRDRQRRADRGRHQPRRGA